MLIIDKMTNRQTMVKPLVAARYTDDYNQQMVLTTCGAVFLASKFDAMFPEKKGKVKPARGKGSKGANPDKTRDWMKD